MATSSALLMVVQAAGRALQPSERPLPLPARENWMPLPMDTTASFFDVASQFGRLVVDQDFHGACLLLSSEARPLHSPESMKSAVEAMISYTAGPILDFQVIEDATVEDWPAKKPGDVAVMVLALIGAGFSEAVTLTLVEESAAVLIRDLTWGRP